MGSFMSKCYPNHEETIKLRAKTHALEEQIKELNCYRIREARAYEQHVMLFAYEEEQWRKERNEHREEAERLRKRVEEGEERMRKLEAEVAAAAAAASRGGRKECRPWMGTEYIVEQMKEEQARREVAVEKWKQLYLAIKTELDDLIQTTGKGERCCWEAEEGLVEGLRKELKDKEEATEALRSRVAAMEKERGRRERETDILRQSLRILTSKKRSYARKRLPRSLWL